MTTSISERLEQSARQVTLTKDGFETLHQGNMLVMGTPTAVVATTLFVTQWVCIFTAGGVDKRSAGVNKVEDDSPSLEDLLSMYEDNAA